MTLSFGLNVKPKTAAKPPPSKKPKASIFDSDNESDDDAAAATTSAAESITTLDFSAPAKRNNASAPSSKSSKPRPVPSGPPPSLSSRQPRDDFVDLTSTRASLTHAAEAESLDPNLYDYDSFLTSKSALDAQRQAAKRQDAVERKAKYIGNLLAAADQRKQDQMVARDKALQKEREAEGEEVGETFVTEAYKKQREETRRVEEEERGKREEEERRRGKGGRAKFLAGVLGEQESTLR